MCQALYLMQWRMEMTKSHLKKKKVIKLCSDCLLIQKFRLLPILIFLDTRNVKPLTNRVLKVLEKVSRYFYFIFCPFVQEFSVSDCQI